MIVKRQIGVDHEGTDWINHNGEGMDGTYVIDHAGENKAAHSGEDMDWINHGGVQMMLIVE